MTAAPLNNSYAKRLQPTLEERANEWVEAQGFTKGTIRAARKAFIHAFNVGGREGWMRCGVFHIDIAFEAKPEEIENAQRRWPL